MIFIHVTEIFQQIEQKNTKKNLREFTTWLARYLVKPCFHLPSSFKLEIKMLIVRSPSRQAKQIFGI